MSTKIYNGYMLRTKSLDEINQFIKKFRNEAKEIVVDEVATLFAENLYCLIDDAHVMDEETFMENYIQNDEGTLSNEEKLNHYQRSTPFTFLMRRFQDRYDVIQKTGIRDNEVDFDCEAVFIPVKDKTLVLFYSEKKKFNDIWEKQEELKYYGYWNNTDPDEKCTKKEWTQRKLDWDEALPGYSIPSECGLIGQFVKGFPKRSDIDMVKILEKIPSLEKRTQRIAYRTVLNEKAEHIKKDLLENGEEINGYQIYRQARDWTDSEEGKKKVEEETEFMKKIIPQEITRETLIQKIIKLKEETIA